jgi:hypothetical protein
MDTADEIVTVYGGAALGDNSFANVVAVDEEVIMAIAIRERLRARRERKRALQAVARQRGDA